MLYAGLICIIIAFTANLPDLISGLFIVFGLALIQTDLSNKVHRKIEQAKSVDPCPPHKWTVIDDKIVCEKCKLVFGSLDEQ